MEKTHTRSGSHTVGSAEATFWWLHKSWTLFGITFAPLMIPMERRIQMLSQMFWNPSTVILLSTTSSVILYKLFQTQFWWLTILYITWMVYDSQSCHRGGKKGFLVDWVRGWILWRLYLDYFPTKMIKTAELDPNKNYLVGSHPHGVICSGAAVCWASDAADVKKVFPGMDPRLLTLTMFFNAPGHRELGYLLGMSAASRPNMDCLLSRPGGGVAAMLVVGGAREALLYNTTQGKITLIIRKGFIKIALRNGSDLVPTFSFGESKIYRTPPNQVGTKLRKFQDTLLKYTGFPLVIPFGRGVFQYAFGLIPHRRPIHVVIGAPVSVEKIDEPTQDDIDKLHSRYVEAVQQLFDDHKVKYGEDDLTLDINPKH